MAEEDQSLEAALDTAYAEEAATQPTEGVPDAGPAPEEVKPEAPAEEVTPEPEATPEAAAEPSSDPSEAALVGKLTQEELEKLKSTPEGLKLYKGLMQSYTPRMQELAEKERQFARQAQMWDALNSQDETIRRRAVSAMVAATGMKLAEESPAPVQPEVDEVAEEMNRVFGPEAAAIMRPVFEKLAQKVAQNQIQPMQQATDALQLDVRARQAQAQVAQFKAAAQAKGWEISPDVEAKMAELGQQLAPAQPIQTVEGGVKHLEMLYTLATAETKQKAASTEVVKRMQKAAAEAEPTRGVPSGGQERRTKVTDDMSFDEAFDTAIQEARAETGL